MLKTLTLDYVKAFKLAHFAKLKEHYQQRQDILYLSDPCM